MPSADTATVELTLDQIRNAILQLPESQRRKLLAEIERIPSQGEAREAARQARGTFRMSAKQRKRMSELLAKGNDGTLTAEESREVDELVSDFERKTLEMTQAIARSKQSA